MMRPFKTRPRGFLSAQRPRIVALVALCTVPLLVLAAANGVRGTVETEARVVEQRVALARAAAVSAGAYVDGHLSTLRALALTPFVTDPRTPGAGTFFGRLAAERPEWESICIFDNSGSLLAGASEADCAATAASQPKLDSAITTGQPVVSAAVVNPRTGRPVVLLAAPVEFAGGARGVLGVGLSVAVLDQELRRFHGSDVRISVVDQDGNVFVDSGRSGGAALASALDRPETRDVLAGNSGSRRFGGPDGAEQLVAYAPAEGLGWGVFAIQPADMVFGPVRRYQSTAVALLAMTAGATAAIGWYLGGHLSRSYQRELEAKAASESALRESARMKDEFLAVVSHELRTPLTAISGYTEILLRQTQGPLTERQERQLRSIRDAARRQLALINDLLDASKLEAGAMELHLEAVPPMVAVTQAAAAVEVIAAAHEVTLTVLDPLAPLPAVAADPERLQQILLNLLSNAIKFTPSGGSVEIGAHAAVDAGGPSVEFRVRDTGIGIPPSHLSHIWDRFYQAESSTSRRFGGTGLGLTIVKRLAELQDGRVEARSAGVDQGSTFSVWLPATPAVAAAPNANGRAPAATVPASEYVAASAGRQSAGQ